MSSMFTRSKRPAHAIDMAPLIDVVFLLLIFFMLTSNFTPPSMPLKLPKSQEGAPTVGEAVIVSMDASGTLEVHGEKVTMDLFGAKLKEVLASVGTSTVHFRGDRAMGYGDFVELMDVARKSGAAQFNLVHEALSPEQVPASTPEETR